MGVAGFVYMLLSVIGLWLNRASEQYKPVDLDDSSSSTDELESHIDEILLVSHSPFSFFIFHFIPSYIPSHIIYFQEDDRCPYEDANFLSRATFW
jgi:hypothetical protein